MCRASSNTRLVAAGSNAWEVPEFTGAPMIEDKIFATAGLNRKGIR